MVLNDNRGLFPSGAGVGDETGRELMEVNDEMEPSREVEVGFLHETPATSTCLTMSLPSSRERGSEEHSTSLSSDPVQTTADKCSVLSGLP